MRLSQPSKAPNFNVKDIYGKPLNLEDYKGKPVILSFFRDAACPFCNMRVYEYTRRYEGWNELDIEVIAIFSSPSEAVREFVAKHPRPFRTVGDPDLELYNTYGIGSSAWGFIKVILFKMSTIKEGKRKGGKTNWTNPNRFLLPADFIIGPNGKVLDVWYGKDQADHMPMKRLEKFVDKVRLIRNKQQRQSA